jgi:SAM-dependent methyltransferase
MTTEEIVEQHYGRGRLRDAIRTGIAALGKTDRITPDDLAAVDEFHIGGRAATDHLLAQVSLDPSMHVLDVGSGIGGPARHIAQAVGCRVTGIDLTAEHVGIADELTAQVGLDDRVRFIHGSALSIPAADASFDVATMLHVGMNIQDKSALFREVARVLRPGAVFAVYDVMQTGASAVRYPVPWARVPDTSFLGEPSAYRAAAEAAGFDVDAESNRRASALEFFAKLRASSPPGAAPPALGLHLVLGPDATTMIANMATNIENGALAPVEMICRRVSPMTVT